MQERCEFKLPLHYSAANGENSNSFYPANEVPMKLSNF